MTIVLKKLVRESSLLAPDFRSFKRQESAFLILNLIVLSTLLLLHTLLSSYFGTPPRSLFVVLAAGFFLSVFQLTWVQSTPALSAAGIVMLTWTSISINMILAFALASLSYRQDIQYFVLLVIPVLQAAFRFSLGPAVSVLAASIALEFFWVWNYFRLHPPPDMNEYIEAGTIALIYATTGILVWTLVQYLRAKESELENARERLVTEEKLAAVGRFSSAIAHEIRNPVAMISSALETAQNPGMSPAEREEMFEIAGKEASRLVKLTSDFLEYARPKPPAKHLGDISESIAYIADICAPKAAENAIKIETDAPEGLCAPIDSGQVQQALLNLVRNAIEASPRGGRIRLSGIRQNGSVRVDIENGAGPIPMDVAARIFEPFFTTKPAGTGLGLAIARNIVRSHGGELALAQNGPTSVQFSMTLPVSKEGLDQ